MHGVGGAPDGVIIFIMTNISTYLLDMCIVGRTIPMYPEQKSYHNASNELLVVTTASSGRSWRSASVHDQNCDSVWQNLVYNLK